MVYSWEPENVIRCVSWARTPSPVQQQSEEAALAPCSRDGVVAHLWSPQSREGPLRMTSPRSLGLWEKGEMLSSKAVQLACSAGGKVGPSHLLRGYFIRADLRLGFLGGSSLQRLPIRRPPQPGRQGCPEVAAERVQQDHLTLKDSPGHPLCPQSPSEKGPCWFFLHKVAGASEQGISSAHPQ